ncbi:MAG: hypothetical protein ACT443_11795 [Gemmatimonadota bacterium]
MSKRALPCLAVSLLSAGCWEFVAPDFPEAGAPAVLQANVTLSETGSLDVSAVLVPGLTFGGFQREVADDRLNVNGIELAPVAVRRNGTRAYQFVGQLDDGAVLSRPFVLVAPVVQDVTGPPPRVSWFGIRKADPDTIVWMRGEQLVLRVDTTLAPSMPPPQIQQWFLDLRGRERSFRVSSDGFPPAELHIPSEWLPESNDGIIVATMTFFQSGQQRSPAKDYLGSISLTVVLRWTIRAIPS